MRDVCFAMKEEGLMKAFSYLLSHWLKSLEE
jgi:hypothetical protein